MAGFPRHQCFIYDGSPAPNLGTVAAVAVRKLSANRRCLYMNSPPMVAGFRSYLAAAGIDVAAAVAKRTLLLSADDTHLIQGRFDSARMLDLLSNAVDEARRDGFDGLWATGDMTWEFGSEKNLDKLLEYEYGLEELFARQPTLCGICQYHRDTLPLQAISDAFHTHRAVVINETLSRMNPYYVIAQCPRRSLSRTEIDELLHTRHNSSGAE